MTCDRTSSRSPTTPRMRPKPLALHPPNGAAACAEVVTASLSATDPTSSRSASRVAHPEALRGVSQGSGPGGGIADDDHTLHRNAGLPRADERGPDQGPDRRFQRRVGEDNRCVEPRQLDHGGNSLRPQLAQNPPAILDSTGEQHFRQSRRLDQGLTNRTTAEGNPASSIEACNRFPRPVASSDGFQSTAFPAANAPASAGALSRSG